MKVKTIKVIRKFLIGQFAIMLNFAPKMGQKEAQQPKY